MVKKLILKKQRYSLQKNLKNWNVKNFAVNGYGAHQMLAQIENEQKILRKQAKEKEQGLVRKTINKILKK